MDTLTSGGAKHPECHEGGRSFFGWIPDEKKEEALVLNANLALAWLSIETNAEK